MFAANKYQIVRIALGTGARSTMPTIVSSFPCRLSETISDISATCNNEGRCGPIVLLRSNASRVVDCAADDEMMLQQEPTLAQNIALHRTGNGGQRGNRLLALHSGSLVEYSSTQNRSGWTPHWDIAHLGQGVRSLDLLDDRLFLFFQDTTADGSGAVLETLNLNSMEPVGKWRLSRAGEQASLQAGCAIAPDEVALLLQGDRPRLMRARTIASRSLR